MNSVINQGFLYGFTVFFLFFLLQHKFFCNFVRDYSQTDSLASAFRGNTDVTGSREAHPKGKLQGTSSTEAQSTKASSTCQLVP